MFPPLRLWSFSRLGVANANTVHLLMLRSLGSVICNSSFCEILLFCIPAAVWVHFSNWFCFCSLCGGLTELNSQRSAVCSAEGFQSTGGRHRRHNLLPLFASISISCIDVFLRSSSAAELIDWRMLQELLTWAKVNWPGRDRQHRYLWPLKCV